MKRQIYLPFLFAGGLLPMFLLCGNHNASLRTQKEALGKLIFQDTLLSEPVGQSCATCHTTSRGFADATGRVISEGAVTGLFSQRNSMTICYSMYVPSLYWDDEEETYIGGLFWDGRSSSLQHQAGIPFLNPVEMGNADRRMVIDKIRRVSYFPELIRLYGETDHIDSLYAHVTDALAVYQQSDEVSPFTSKFDAWKGGKYKLTAAEKRGLDLFEDKGECAECHIMEEDERVGRVLFTDHTYDNLGIPRHPENLHFGVPATYFLLTADSIDLGLGPIVGRKSENGKFRVPTLRNIALTAPYGHNGYFNTLQEIVHFYNVRDVSDEFPPAEYPATINRDELGNLRLTPQEEADIVEFMHTLTDDFTLPEKQVKL